jgi:hypothetical protein
MKYVDDFGYETNELRVLPIGDGENILCSKCGYEREIKWRKERNKNLEDFAKFDLPKWKDLKIYESE